MNPRPVFHLISYMIMVLAMMMAVTLGIAWLMDDPSHTIRGFALSTGITLVIGLILWELTRGPIELTRREGVGIVVFGWLTAVILGALPFLFCRTIQVDHPVDALFESISGFTTTGASVLTNLEERSHAILLWRAITHFLGGMGILVLVVAIIPFLGVGGMQIYRAEMAGPSKDRLTPRIASTAKLLWGVYVALNLALILLLKFGGMSWFDSVCHAFATIATGGFSTRTASIAAYDSLYIETVITVFMFLAGLNFALHFRALKGDVLAYAKNAEARFYLMLWLGACLACTADLWLRAGREIGSAVRGAFFTVTSILTTTGFGTDDYNQWPALSQVILVLLMFVGGCAGSTAGGIKNIRLFVLLKKTTREIRLFLHPQAVYHIKIGGRIIEPAIVGNIMVFFFIFVMIFTFGSILMSLYTEDLITAVSAVIAALGNIGPGLGAVGPTENYAHIHPMGKLVLSLCMLLGRLELYTILILFIPNFWRK